MPDEMEETLIDLFGKLNIETGTINPNVIKAWFDTDSEHFLNWFCSSISEENYISPQEYHEYSNLEHVLTDGQLERETKMLEAKFPNLFDYDANLLEIEIADEMIEVLEEQLQDCNSQLQLNKNLNQSLNEELSQLTAEEIKLDLDKESAQSVCASLGQKLDEINIKSFDQIVKYQSYLNNYENARVPEFISNKDVEEFEDKFNDTSSSIMPLIKTDGDSLEMPKSFVRELSVLQNRLFHSKISNLTNQMESEMLSYLQTFLLNYDVDNLSLFADCEEMESNIEFTKTQQLSMFKIIEESCFKDVEKCVNQATLQCTKNELNYCKSRLNYFIQFKEILQKLLSHLVVVSMLYLQETLDIGSSKQFFKTFINYINQDLENVITRKGALVKIIAQHENYMNSSIEEKLKLIGNCGSLLLNNTKASLTEILKEANHIRDEVQRLREHRFSCNLYHSNNVEDLKNNIRILENFLTCGPTSQIVIISPTLKQSLDDIAQVLDHQNSCVKSLMQIIQKSKEIVSKDHWLNMRRQLWMYFLTDPKRMLALLEELKNNVDLTEAKNRDKAL